MPKKFFFLTASVLFCLLLAGNALAFSVKAPASMLVFDSPREFFIEVKNDSSAEKPLEVKFFSPAFSELVDVPEDIKANSEAVFVLRVLPNKELAGQTYESTLVVELGNEKSIKKIGIAFKEPVWQEPKPAQPDSQSLGLNFVATGFASLLNFGSIHAINIALVLVAAILLVAFIARFLKIVVKK